MQPKVIVKCAQNDSFSTKSCILELKNYKLVKCIYFIKRFIYNRYLKYYM